jgi:ABC-2 type transport system ATP-binding protein
MTSNPPNGAETVLRAENLTKRYGDLLAVDRLSLEARGGEILGFLGPNGAGKTTAIGMMCGLLRPDAGETFVRGRPVRGGDPEALARVGLAPQTVILWPKLTCLEQLEFVGEMYGMPRPDARRRGRELLETVGLAEKANKLARTLSGGMQRRLNLVLALVHDPEIVILDEPEAGLDPQGRVLVRDYIRSLARERGKTVILTTHNMDEADRLADRVAIIDRGRLLTLDTPEELKHRVGEGDVLEIEVSDASGAPSGSGGPGVPGEGADHPVLRTLEELARARGGVGAIGATGATGACAVSRVGHVITLRARDAVNLVAAALDALRSAGFRPGAVHLRETTLEDVFIAFTGRSLRE